MAVPFSTPVKMGCRAVGGEGAGAAAASWTGGFTSGACAHEIARLLRNESWVPRLGSGFRRRAADTRRAPQHCAIKSSVILPDLLQSRSASKTVQQESNSSCFNIGKFLMATLEITFLHGQLEERKRRLETALAVAPRNAGLAGLLRDV